MRRLRSALARAAGMFGRSRREQELADEIESHLQLHIADNIRAGMTPEEARRRAVLRFGPVESIKESYRDRRGVPALETLAQDVRSGVRMLRKSPGFTLVVMVTLALGIGANTAIFSVVHAVLLRPLPFADPDRLVRVWSAYPEEGVELGTTSPLDLADWRAQSGSFAAIAGYPNLRLSGFVLTGGEAPEELETVFVSEGFFEVFGVEPALGRTLRGADHREGDNRVVVVSHGAWQRRFGADPGLFGATVILNGEPFTVVGVMPPDFVFPAAGVEMWAPQSLIPESGIPRLRPVRWLSVVARLAPGVSIEQARAEMAAITGRLAREYPDSNDDLTATTIRPLHEQLVGEVRPAVLTLFAAVGLLLLIGCANVANLVLARSEERTREVAVRAALGAGKLRLVRQVLTESLVLSLLGGVLAIAVALAGSRLLVGLAPAGIPRLESVGIDATVLAFTLAASLLTGLLFGMVPALRITATSLQGTLKEGARGSSGGGGRLRGGLIVAEVALVAVVSIAAGLLIRTYSSLRDVDPGFRPDNVITLRVAARATEGYVDFFREALERIEALPGVEAAGMIRPLPLAGDTFQGESFGFSIPGRPEPDPQDQPEAYLRFTSPGYFEAMGIPLLAGRDFADGDVRDAPPVLIVSRAAAERYWPDDDPVGSIVTVGDNEATIIGLVGDVRQMSLMEEPEPVVYGAHSQISRVGMTLVVRTAADPAGLIDPIRRQIWELRPDQPINDIASMNTVIAASVAQPRFAMALLSLFAGLALCLAAVGIYGVISYSVGRRRREIGIRMALGARPSEVLRLVVRNGIVLALFGVALGLLAAVAATRLMASLLFGVPPLDPPTFIAAAALLLAVAALASAVPALRASRVDPVVALRR